MNPVVAGIILALLILFGGFKLWEYGEKTDLQTCKEKYGINYTLGHSSANSSIKWCQSPTGEVKAL